jgi:oligopeptidase B
MSSPEKLPPLSSPPLATPRPHVVASDHGHREDPYYWLRDDLRSDPDVLEYLTLENRWYEQHASRYASLRTRLFDEIKGRIKEDDASVPYRSHGYFYYTRFDEGLEYPIYCRKKDADGAQEEILLEVNAMARGHDFFQAFPAALSYAQDLMAYAVDTSGRRQYVLRIRRLLGGEEFAETITATSSDCVFSRDGKVLFYVENDAETLRSWRVKKHVLGSDPKDDAVVYEEADTSFFTSIGETGSEDYIVIHVSSTVSDEERVLRADDPDGTFQLVAPRARDFHYEADHIGGHWIVRTDWDAPNYRLMKVACDALGDRAHWRDLVPHSEAIFINAVQLFDNYFVIDERSEGLRRLRIQPWQDALPVGEPSYVLSDEPAYTAALGINPEQSSEVLRYIYTSLTTPESTYDLNMRTGERILRKRQPVLGGYDPANYATERVWVPARDGVQIPVSLAYRRGTTLDGSAPMLQYAYGSYGFSIDPAFSSSTVSLLDRGFVYALAHVRGGSEMGRAWYENGKKLNKLNTFTDFIDVTECLVKKGYADGSKVFARGGSAGGLLMGAIANLRGEIYRGLLADVPFVDVVTTMLDESIPLTSNEFDEWGNPKEAEFYRYMLAYSPYDNVAAKAYPAMMVTSGLHDSQVQYFEPTKWVAKLRAMKTNSTPLVLKTNMEAGHGGKSGRFARLREVADQFAFMLDLLGWVEPGGS